MQTRFILRNDRMKHSNPIWGGQPIFFGWQRITKNLDNNKDAIGWYKKHQLSVRFLCAELE